MSLFDLVRQEAQKVGLDPDFAARVMQQESGGRADLTSSAGAVGPMQLMPATARGLGVNPYDDADNVRGGVRYLKQQMDAFGDPTLAAAAYNAGPGAVKKYGGVPPFKETQKYVRNVTGGSAALPSAADLLSDHPQAQAANPAAMPSAADLLGAPTPKPPVAPSRLPQKAAAPAPRPGGPTIAQDALSGFLQPWKDFGHTVMEGYRSTEGGKPLDPLFIPKLAGAGANLSTSLLLPAVRPAARALNNGAAAVGLSPHDFTWNPKAPFRQLQGDEAQRKTEGDIMTALSAAQPAGARFQTMPKPKAMSLDQLQTAKSAAYKAVESSGVQVTPQGFGDLSADITQKVAAGRINPLRHPKAASMVSDIQDMAAQGYSPTLTELDQLRQVVRRDVANPKVDDGDQHFGNMIIGAIDDFVQGAKGPQVTAPPGVDPDGLLKTARDLNTRYRKVEAVTNARESAVQRAGSTASGGNVNNATAQNIRRFTDPTSGKYMRNMTPDERKLAESIVKPGTGQNLLRLLGKLSPSGNGLMAALNLGATMHNPAMGAVGLTGIAAKAASDGATASKIDQLIKLMSMGGSAARPAAPIPMLTMAGKPALPILSPAGLVGSGVVAAPLTRTRAVAIEEKASGRPGRGKQRRK